MMRNKKGGTMSTVFLGIIFTMVLFFGLFNYVNSNYASANVTVPADYYGTNTTITELQDNLTTAVENVKGKASNISQADAGASFVAWNGLTGIGATIKLFFVTIDVGVGVWNALFPALSFIPVWIKLLFEVALVIWITLIVIGAFKGEAKT